MINKLDKNSNKSKFFFKKNRSTCRKRNQLIIGESNLDGIDNIGLVMELDQQQPQQQQKTSVESVAGDPNGSQSKQRNR